MQTVDKFKLALGIFWSLCVLYFIILLFPPVDRRLRKWEAKLKNAKGTSNAPSRPQRVVFLLLAILMAAVILADAFHYSLAELTCISSGTQCLLMIILPALYFVLGLLKKRSKDRQLPEP